MDEHKLLRQRELARKAKELVECEAFVDALKTIDAELIERIREETNPAIRDVYWQAMQCFAQLPKVLRKTMATGRMAESDLNNLQAIQVPRAA